MRKIIYILLLSTLFFGACYKDKGSYDYNPIPKIEMKGLEQKYTIMSMDKLQITPNFKDKQDYACTWTMFSKSIINPLVDTISTDPNLDYLVKNIAGNYTLVLTVENQKNGDKQIFKTDVAVETPFTKGWYVLKNINGKTDFDHFTTAWKLSNNILATVHGSSLAGNPVGIAQTPSINYVDKDGGRQSQVRTLWVVSENNGKILRMDDMALAYNLDQAFYTWIPDQQPIGIQNLHTSMAYYSNQGLFNMFVNIGSAMHRFSTPLKISNLSAGDPESYLLAKQNYSTPGMTMYYDELNFRFLTLINGALYRFMDVDNKGNPVEIKPNKMNVNVLYMSKSGNNGYALMADRSKPDRYLYKLEINAYVYGTNYYAPIIGNRTLPAGLKIYQAKVYGHNVNLAYIFYSTGNDLHMFDYDANKETLNILPQFDGTVTLIQQVGSTFVIATEKGGRYKIYLYEMLAGKPDPSKVLKVIEGEGSAQGVYFAGS